MVLPTYIEGVMKLDDSNIDHSEHVCKNCKWWKPIDRDGTVYPSSTFVGPCNNMWIYTSQHHGCGNFISMR